MNLPCSVIHRVTVSRQPAYIQIQQKVPTLLFGNQPLLPIKEEPIGAPSNWKERLQQKLHSWRDYLQMLLLEPLICLSAWWNNEKPGESSMVDYLLKSKDVGHRAFLLKMASTSQNQDLQSALLLQLVGDSDPKVAAFTLQSSLPLKNVALQEKLLNKASILYGYHPPVQIALTMLDLLFCIQKPELEQQYIESFLSHSEGDVQLYLAMNLGKLKTLPLQQQCFKSLLHHVDPGIRSTVMEQMIQSSLPFNEKVTLLESLLEDTDIDIQVQADGILQELLKHSIAEGFSSIPTGSVTE